MKLEMTGHLRMEQKMKLAPHMIQSMEILQLSILALQERIEQELNSNPVLEVDEPERSEDVQVAETDEQSVEVTPATTQLSPYASRKVSRSGWRGGSRAMEKTAICMTRNQIK